MPKYYVRVSRGKRLVGFIPSKANASIVKIRRELSKVRRKGTSFRILTEAQFKRLFVRGVIGKIRRGVRRRLRARRRTTAKRRVVRRRRR